ncbi:MAG TPA: peptide ABC transporter substrate-binding protein [Candidatus Limnocylindrales bacterium]|nr:peptide ABC transporter substrate-binding protein [Candidatus Limnocylindrales bacterium]
MSQKRLLALVGAVAIVASACGGTPASQAPASQAPGASVAPSTEPSAELADEQIIRWPLIQDPATIDPTMAQDSQSTAVLTSVQRGLVYIDKDLNLVPGLAESWDISPDAKTITFHLKDAQYSNGDPIVAADLVYSWKRLVDPRTAAPYSYVMAEVVGGQDLLDLAGAKPAATDAVVDAALEKFGVAAPDEKTFVVTLAFPATYFLSVATMWVTVPIQEKWITSEGATETGNYVASGPFTVESWDHNAQIVLKPNPNWYGEKPTLTEIQMPIFAELAEAQRAYEADEVDSVYPIPDEDIARIKDDPAFADQYSVIPTLGIAHYDYNNGVDPSGEGKLARCPDEKTCPTVNKDFRIALTQAIDKQAFIDATFSGIGTVANSFVMPGLPGYDETIDPYPFDLTAAKASMDKALASIGYASAADIPALKFGFNTGAGHEPRVAFLAEAWNQAFGLKTEQIGSEFSVFLTQRTAGEYDIARDAWGADYPHANNQLSGNFTCGGGNNNSQYCNPAFDALLLEAASEPDATKQADLYKQAGKILADDAADLPLLYRDFATVVKTWVDGEIVTPIDHNNPGDKFAETIKILKH